MEIIKDQYHQVVISRMLHCPKFRAMRQGDKVLKTVQIFPEYIQYLNDSEFLLDVLTLAQNLLEHKKIERGDQE